MVEASYRARGYGLIYGGKGLDGNGATYVALLVRGDGQYMVERRDGAKTTTLVPWTANAAIKSVNAADPAVNVVEIDAMSNPKKLTFKVNGKTVHAMDAVPADVKGIVGLRAGRSLDLQIDAYDVKS